MMNKIVFSSRGEIESFLEAELAKPAVERVSATVLFDAFGEARRFDDPHNIVAKLALQHSNVTVELLEQAYFGASYFKGVELLETFVNERESYSDDLLIFTARQANNKVWHALVEQLYSGKVFTDDQVNIVWNLASFTMKNFMVESSKVFYADSSFVLPDYAWVEYYLLCNRPTFLVEYFDIAKRGNSLILGHFGDEECLRLVLVKHVSGFSEGVDVSGLPLSWLIELGLSDMGDSALIN